MARKYQTDKLDKIYRTVEENPGKRPGAIARLLGISRSQVTRALPAMEECGYYLSEDDGGRLWPFHRRDK